MFDFVHNNKRVVQVVLALIAIPFALFGIDAYQRAMTTNEEVAKVDGMAITRVELSRAMQDQQDRMRQMLGRSFDASMFDTPEAREAVLEGLVSQRLVTDYVLRRNITVTDAELQRTIGAMDAFHENGKFSVERYSTLLKSQGMTPVQFQESYRRDLALQRLNGALAESVIVSKTLAKQWATAQTEQRETSELAFPAAAFAPQVKLAPDAVESYYKANLKDFAIPEQARVEFVALNPESVASRETVTPEEVRKAYDDNFGAKAKERDAARKKIEGLLAQARQNPDRFGALAKADSEDPGSAAQDGDLGFFGRGMMVKPFEDAVFRMKPGEISPIVESEFGFHIIQMVEARKGKDGEERRARHILIKAPSGVKDFAAARPEIEAELRKRRAGDRFAKEADRFQVLADQDQESLKPFVEEFKLPVQQSGWIAKGQPSPQAGVLANPKLVEAIFNPKLVASKRATEAIEAAPNVLVVARIIEHRPAGQRTLEEARGEITAKLTRDAADALARKAGEAQLEALKKDPTAAAKWGPPRLVSREKPEGLGRDALAAVFRVDAAKLPGFAGSAVTGGGYSIYRVSKVSGGAVDEKRVEQIQQGLDQASARDQTQGFIAGLRGRGKVEINKANLEKKN